ncbi:MAG: hypothetical protein JWR22_4214 [Herminiimonas sp.]|nr:hypothetical protein [Herminiimonas sp.]
MVGWGGSSGRYTPGLTAGLVDPFTALLEVAIRSNVH